MPCYTVQRSKVEFLAKSTNVPLLKVALESLGYRVSLTSSYLTFADRRGREGSYEVTTGRMTLPVSQDIDEIKRAYSEEIVNTQAKRAGWKVRWTTNEAGNREAEIERRSL